MTRLDSPLYELFDYLRRSSVPIGTGDYLLAVNTLCNGKGTGNLAKMRFVLKLLWAKSEDDLFLIDQAFERYFTPAFRSETQEFQSPPPQNHSDRKVQKNQEALQQPNKNNLSDKQVDSKNKGKDNRSHTAPSRPNKSKRLTAQEQELLQPPQKTLGLNPDDVPTSKSQRYFSHGSYILTRRLPLSRREMSGIWKHLRKMTRSGPKTELDVENTLKDICRNGIFVQPTMRAIRKNKSQLLTLIDSQGSMQPFEPFTNALLESIQLGGVFERTKVFYFHNCPKRSVATGLGLLNYEPLEEILEQHNGGILIVSDAGAARNIYRTERVKHTQDFLGTLFKHTHLVSWLNPVPQVRWQSNSAEHIAEYVPMFPLNRNGLVDTVNVLQGRGAMKRVQRRD